MCDMYELNGWNALHDTHRVQVTITDDAFEID